MERMFSRWDPLNPTNWLAATLLGWAFSVYHRPHLPEVLPSYMRFDDLMPWAWWGWAALIIAVGMLFTPRSSGWRLLAHAGCGIYLLSASVMFGAGVGITSEVSICAILAAVSVVLFARTAVHWSSGMGWWRKLVERPPRWLRWLAGVQEYERPEREKGG